MTREQRHDCRGRRRTERQTQTGKDLNIKTNLYWEGDKQVNHEISRKEPTKRNQRQIFLIDID